MQYLTKLCPYSKLPWFPHIRQCDYPSSSTDLPRVELQQKRPPMQALEGALEPGDLQGPWSRPGLRPAAALGAILHPGPPRRAPLAGPVHHHRQKECSVREASHPLEL